jgi:hypothetical protein
MVAWIILKAWLKKSWKWCKKYYQYLLGFLTAAFIYLLSRPQKISDKVFNRTVADHEREIEIIKNNSQNLENDLEKAHSTRTADIIHISEKFVSGSQDLATKTENMEDDLLRGSEDNVINLSEELGKLTGFEVIEPDKE